MFSLSARKKEALKWGYDRLWHRWPLMLWPLITHFKKENGYFPNILRPRSLNEKVLYRMLFDRRDFFPTFAGKVESRVFVSRRLGNDDALIPLIGVIDTVEDVEKIPFPRRFVMKASHGSGMHYFHTVDTPPDLDHLKKLCRQWLEYDFAKYSLEWCYKNVRRAVVVEQLITDKHGEIPSDYKFFCYDGVPRFVQIDSARFTAHTCDIFDSDWNFIPAHSAIPNSAEIPGRSPNLPAMIAMAATLSRGVDFLRVDLYDLGDTVKFGELTSTPARASDRFEPRSADFLLGENWNQSTRQYPREMVDKASSLSPG